MKSPQEQRKERVNALNDMLEAEAPLKSRKVFKEFALEYGLTKEKVKEYLDILNYKIEDNQIIEVE